MEKLFGTDGIRFIYNQNIVPLIQRVMNALGVFKLKEVIIGYDTRSSSLEILKIITQYLPCEKIINVGVLSTPGLSYISQVRKNFAIMITASHNPKEYNGLKFINNGLKLSKKQQKKIELEYQKIKKIIKVREETTLNVNEPIRRIYLDYVYRFIRKENITLGFDFANGSISSYGESIIKKLNTNNLCMSNKPNGENINDGCGATHPEEIQKYVKEHHLDFGFCFDGDGDRVLLVDKDKIYDGDAILYILAKHFKMKKNKIVVTPYSNLGLIDGLKKIGIQCIVTKSSGDNAVLEILKKKHLSLGGESSGHIIVPEYLMTGDGLIISIILSRLLNEFSLKELLKGYVSYPFSTISIPCIDETVINNPCIQNKIQEYKRQYGSLLNLHVRLSGTERKIRIHICHPQKEVVLQIKNELVTMIQCTQYHIQTRNMSLLQIDEKCHLKKGVQIEGVSILSNVKIGEHTYIESSTISNSVIGDNVIVGPYAHIHKNSVIKEDCRIGNYVEIKHSELGKNTKVAHLAYIGDAICGEDVNFGCGSVTVNYDGKQKHITKIGSHVFIGCNVNLIAPLEIGDNTFVAAGSTITESLKERDFAIARSRQIVKEDKALEYPYFHREEV